MTVCQKKVDGILRSSSMTISSQSKAILWIYFLILRFWWDTFFSNSLTLLSHYLPINFFYWTPFPFFCFRILCVSTQFLWTLTCLRLVQPQSSVSYIYLPSCFMVSGFCSITLNNPRTHSPWQNKKPVLTKAPYFKVSIP